MTKKMVNTVLKDIKYSLDGTTLEEALHKIKGWIQEYGGNTKIDVGQEQESYSDSEYAYVRLMGVREETDEAYEKRVAYEAEQTAYREAYEKKEFERLQKKFGDTK